MSTKGDKQGKPISMKFLILGDMAIGKSCLIERYYSNTFKTNYLATIGVDVRKKRLEINNCDVDVAINDTAGQERFRSITRMYYKGADGILVGFDLTNKNTFSQVNYWIEQIEANKTKDNPISIVLFGNKCDAKEQIEVKDDEIQSLKEKYNFEYFATSAKDGTNVQNAFEYLIKNTLKTKGFLEKIGLSPEIPFDNIEIKVKENQKIEVKSGKQKRKKKPC